MPDEKQQTGRAGQRAQKKSGPPPEDGPVAKVTAREAGAKRDSFFRKRDYE